MSNLIGKTVLITGGTGSFGKTVLRRLLEEDEVLRIIVFSRDEKKQHDMRLLFANPKIEFEIGDVRDTERVNRVMRGVDMVFHAAAMKQVPACEFFPIEAVKTNIIGTENVINAAIYQKVEKIVVLSTDKAAYPVNAMGCSKMMMEKLMVARAISQRETDPTILCGVRYGNVLYSRGSVVPLFVDQIKRGVPLTITHPDMTRFLMPLSEAIELVLYALRHGNNGDLFIRKAASATVGDLAGACIELFGGNSPVNVFGVRAGEKMHETLATSEELARAKDQGNYWRIPCERGHEFDKYYVDGMADIATDEGFSSENATRMNVDDIKVLLKSLPEIQDELLKAE